MLTGASGTDGELFVSLLLKHQTGVYSYVRSMVCHRSDADDLLQEIAMVAWKQFGTYDRDRPFEHWLYGIARNLIRAYYRRKSRDAVRFSEETVNLLVSESVAVCQRSDEYLSALEGCVERLSEQDRVLIRRRYKPGATNRSLANELGWTDSKISRRMSRIYATLMVCVRKRVEGGAT